MSRNLSIIILGLFFTVGLGLALTGQAFNEPLIYPPNDNIQPPILTGPGSHVRYGPLRLLNQLNAQGDLISHNEITVTSVPKSLNVFLNGLEQFCLGADCITGWEDGGPGGNLLRLSPVDADLGFIHIQGGIIFQAAESANFALYTRAIAPDAQETYGFYGQSSSGPLNGSNSYGVLGVAAHSGAVPNALAYGIFGGNSDNPNAYAGYFTGRVEITANSELCLLDPNGVNPPDCRTDWPLGGEVGDYLLLQTDFPTTPQEGITAVEGLGQFFSAAIGDSAGHSEEVTCGDGSCDNGETTLSCPVDCPEITGITAVWQSATTALFTWDSNTSMYSVVEYGLNTAYGSKLIDDNFVVNHSILVDDLYSSKDYHYRVGGATRGSGAFLFSADQLLPLDETPSDNEPPPMIPTILSYYLHLPDGTPPDDEEFIKLLWNHPKTDLPVGDNSGFSHFNVYRKVSGGPQSILIGTTASNGYLDENPALEQATSYVYSVTALDNAGNESSPRVREIHIGLICSDDAFCQANDPGWNLCCSFSNYLGDNLDACDQVCGGSSPIMAKDPPPSTD